MPRVGRGNEEGSGTDRRHTCTNSGKPTVLWTCWLLVLGVVLHCSSLTFIGSWAFITCAHAQRRDSRELSSNDRRFPFTPTRYPHSSAQDGGCILRCLWDAKSCWSCGIAGLQRSSRYSSQTRQLLILPLCVPLRPFSLASIFPICSTCVFEFHCARDLTSPCYLVNPLWHDVPCLILVFLMFWCSGVLRRAFSLPRQNKLFPSTCYII